MAQTTERAIAQALRKLIAQKPLNKITISDIANECDINRMTFYYHFKDIYDLIEWMFGETLQKTMAGCDTAETWRQGLEVLAQEILEDKTFIMGVYHSLSREQIDLYLHKNIYRMLRKMVDSLSVDKFVAEEDKDFITNFYTYAMSGLVLDWISNGMKTDPNQLLDKAEVLTSGDLLRGLERFEK